MPTIFSRGCRDSACRLRIDWPTAVAGIAFIIALLPSVLPAQDFGSIDREAARSWALHRIAVIQAVRGEVGDAKNTVAEINETEIVSGAGDVTSVSFCNGMIIYNHPPGRIDISRSAACYRYATAVPIPPSPTPPAPIQRTILPAAYFAADSRHGRLVAFSDECDSSGTRVTCRRYADGHVVIETPRS
jgi:hypothetical protein